jgi:hypothetical protein
VARSSMRLVLAGRWPCGLVLVKATGTLNVRTLYGAHLERGGCPQGTSGHLQPQLSQR